MIETKYKFIHFIVVEKKPKTDVWECRNNRSNGFLGEVRWYSAWRQYCFYAEYGCIFNDTCLNDISHFLGQLRAGRKSNNKTEGGG